MPNRAAAPTQQLPQVHIDTDEILRALSLFAEPGQVVELRILHAQPRGQRIPVTVSGYFNDYKALADKARGYYDCARGVYITLNPINPALLARAANRLQVVGKDDPLTTDADVTRRRWLPIDLDPVRPRGISSTAKEHERAIARAFQVRDALRDEGWPDSIVGDSGNGGHLLYRVDLPVHDGDLVKRCIQKLALRFDDTTLKIDQAVFNPARIWKLYGTISRKGDNLPERPHRLAHILEAP